MTKKPPKKAGFKKCEIKIKPIFLGKRKKVPSKSRPSFDISFN